MNTPKNKGGGSIAIVLAAVLLLVAGFGLFECSRLSELKSNLPKYLVTDTYEESAHMARLLSIKVSGIYVNSVGLSNSLYLPFDRSLIVLVQTPYEALEANDFVAYVNDRGVNVLHRIIALRAEGWVAMGDNNAVEDSTRVTTSNYIGRLVEPMFTWQDQIIK
jgi:hypothetical protein